VLIENTELPFRPMKLEEAIQLSIGRTRNPNSSIPDCEGRVRFADGKKRPDGERPRV